MAKLFKCDKCGEQTTDPLSVMIAFERTPEEIQALMAADDAPLGMEKYYAQVSVVNKNLDLCRDCYDEFKKEYYG